MGEARRKLERFLAEQPICCFCGGNTPAETQDHVPPRVLFTNRTWPEGYVFPACIACNNRTRAVEQVIALYALLGANELSQDDQDAFARLVSGVRNNVPHLMPTPTTTANEKKRFLRSIGVELDPGQTTDDLLLARLPAGLADAVAPFFCKLFCAIYYRELGRIFPRDGTVSVTFTTPEYANRGSFDELFRLLSVPRATARANRNLSSQFAYRFESGEGGRVFAVLIHLRGRLLAFVGGVTDRNFSLDSDKPKWRDLFGISLVGS